MRSDTIAAPGWRPDPAAEWVGVVSGIIAAAGVVSLLTFYVLYLATPRKDLAGPFGEINDMCIAVQYLLTIPLALSLRRILRPHAPKGIAVATVVGIGSMLAVVALQGAFIFGFLTIGQQIVWVSIAMIVGVGYWLVTTARVARARGRFPNSLRMSLVAVPYLGYPIWAFWLGKHLLRP